MFGGVFIQKFMRKILFLVFLPLVFPAFSQHTNVMISNVSGVNEPTIFINPKNPWHIVAGSNLNRVYVSFNGGQTWSDNQMSSPWSVWGDPVIIADTAGDFYYFHLANTPPNWIDRIVCQKSFDGGLSWTQHSYTGLDGAKAQDKEWAVVNPINNEIYVTWTQFDKYGSTDPLDSSIIRFSKSSDGGVSWSVPLRLNTAAGNCIDSDSTVEGAVPAVGPNGEIYVAWAGPDGIRFNRSLNGGNTWLANDLFVDSMPGGWDLSIPGIYRCNGMPVTVCDLSNGPGRGTIYINWSDQRNGSHDTDVWLRKSTDGGNTWSHPVRVNDDPPGKQQFFTWMCVDPTTGYLYFVFYDRRNHPDNNTDVYMAVSKDQGNSFINFKISESPFVPSANIFFGDYNNISAQNNKVRPIWTRMHNGQTSIWTALIDEQFLGVDQTQECATDFEEVFPNPFTTTATVCYRIRKPMRVSLEIKDLKGVTHAVIIDNQRKARGKYCENYSATTSGLLPGVYMFVLRTEERISTQKVVVK